MRHIMITLPRQASIELQYIRVMPSLRGALNVEDLKADIAANGVREPIVIQATEDDDEFAFVVIDGARRLEACKQLGHIYISSDVFPPGGKVVPCS